MPPTFRVPARSAIDVWVPIAFNDADAERDSHSFSAAARLKRGRLVRRGAEPSSTRSARRIEAQHDENEGDGATITPMADLGVDQLRPTLVCAARRRRPGAADRLRQRRQPAARAGLGTAAGVRHPRRARRVARPARLAAARRRPAPRAGRRRGRRRSSPGPAPRRSAQSLPRSIPFAPVPRGTAVLARSRPCWLSPAASRVATGLLFSLAPMFGLRRVDAGCRAQGRRRSRRHGALDGDLRTALVGIEVALAVIVLAARRA